MCIRDRNPLRARGFLFLAEWAIGDDLKKRQEWRRETGYKLHLTEMWDEFNEFVMLLSYFHVQIGKTVILY